MNNENLSFRQIHLDFHTSEHISGIGRAFDEDEFADTLVQARVNSITCFSRCHHGWLYYDSKKFPERIHPHIANKNLLKQQIEACHKRGIRVPIYLPVEWDDYTAREHPEWLVINEKGAPVQGVFEAGFYRTLCVNTPYRDFLKEQIKEVLEMFAPVDGLFIDILNIKECCCKYCVNDMKKKGFDPTIKEQRLEYAQWKLDDFKRDITDFIRKYDNNCTIFYNADHIGVRHREAIDTFSHLEIESLPSGMWGYMHFPITVRYARNLGLDCLGMTGKFHTAWGDFHSFKNKAALEYECFHMLALNAGCSIGDQLEPNGKISVPVYELIGSVYSEVEKKEPWCKGAKAIVDIGVFASEEFAGFGTPLVTDEMAGITRMLQESGHQFDIIDTKEDFSKYKVLVLPDLIPVYGEFLRKLNEYVENGGAVIASYKSGLNKEKSEFSFRKLGVNLKGDAPYSPDFIVPEGSMSKGLYNTEYAMYMKGLEVSKEADAEVLCYTKIPYFNRSWEHFCSHKHTPSSGEIGYPGIVKNGKCIYFMHPIFSQYNENAPLWCKKLFLNALSLLLPEPVICHNGPSTMIVTINEQPEKERYVIHSLHYIEQRRSKTIDVLEDVIPLYNVKISVNVPRKIKCVRIVPQDKMLKFEMHNGRVEFILPELNGHQMIELR